MCQCCAIPRCKSMPFGAWCTTIEDEIGRVLIPAIVRGASVHLRTAGVSLLFSKKIINPRWECGIEGYSFDYVQSRPPLQIIMRELSRNSWAIAVVGRIVLGALILLCGPVDGAVGRVTVSASVRPAVVRLPIVDKQDIRVVRVPLEGGSLQSRVVSIAQDRYGFLWFGTDDGLYRMTGTSSGPTAASAATRTALATMPSR